MLPDYVCIDLTNTFEWRYCVDKELSAKFGSLYPIEVFDHIGWTLPLPRGTLLLPRSSKFVEIIFNNNQVISHSTVSGESDKVKERSVSYTAEIVCVCHKR